MALNKLTLSVDTLLNFAGNAQSSEDDAETFSGTCGGDPFCTQGCPSPWDSFTCGIPSQCEIRPSNPCS